MEISGFGGLLTAVVFLPLAGAVLIALFVSGDRDVRLIAGVVALAELVLSIIAFAQYDTGTGGYQLVDKFEDWIPVERFPVPILSTN